MRLACSNVVTLYVEMGLPRCLRTPTWIESLNEARNQVTCPEQCKKRRSIMLNQLSSARLHTNPCMNHALAHAHAKPYTMVHVERYTCKTEESPGRSNSLISL